MLAASYPSALSSPPRSTPLLNQLSLVVHASLLGVPQHIVCHLELLELHMGLWTQQMEECGVWTQSIAWS